MVYLIWQIEPKPLFDALYHARIIVFLPAIIIFVIISFIIDAQNLRALMNTLDYDLTFVESMIIRGASNLITVVDYTLGMGSVVYFLNVTKHIPLVTGTAIMFFYNYINQLSLLVLAVIGYPMIEGFRFSWLTKLMILCLSSFIVSVLVIILVKKSNIGLIEKIKNTGLFDSFAEASLSTYLINVAYRIIFYLTYILFFYVAVKAFNLDIPLIMMVVYVPIILLVISIPVSAFGFGTSQAAMLFLFKDYGSPAQILAFSLAYSVSLLLLRALLGAYFYGILAGRITLEKKGSEGGY